MIQIFRVTSVPTVPTSLVIPTACTPHGGHFPAVLTLGTNSCPLSTMNTMFSLFCAALPDIALSAPLLGDPTAPSLPWSLHTSCWTIVSIFTSVSSLECELLEG